MSSRKVRLLTVIMLVAVLVAGSANLAAAAAGQVRSRWLIGFGAGIGPAETALVKSLGGTNLRALSIIPVISADLPLQAAEALQRNPHVAYVEPDGKVWALAEETPWGVTKVGAPKVWADTTGSGVVVAVLDTGVDQDHPDLLGRLAGGTRTVDAGTSIEDDHGHGTHVAGTILATYNNGIGVVGVAHGAQLYAVKVLNQDGAGSWDSVAAGINAAVVAGADIISMSLGGDGGSITLEAACQAAYDKGVLLVAAAGNDGTRSGAGDTVDFPGRYGSVMAVAATDSNDARAKWSSSGPAVELAAPGVNVTSTYLGGGYATASGTSMATPHVAGVAALIMAAAADEPLTNAEVRDLLTSTARDLGATGKDNLYGYGLVDAVAAYAAIGEPSSNTAPTCSITAPTGGATVGDTVTVRILTDDTETPESLTVTISVDGETAQPATKNSTGQYSFAWDTTTLSDGTHTLTATATDSGNLTGTSSAITVTVANGTTGGGGDWSQDLELDTWTTAGNPAGKVFKKDYTFTPDAGTYAAMSVHIGGTAKVAGGLTVTVYCNGTWIDTQTVPSGTLDISFSRPNASLVTPGQLNTLRVEVGTLYKGDTVSISEVYVSLTAATTP